MLTIILQTATAQQAGSGLWSMVIMFVLILAVMYFFMIRPQKKQQKAIEEMRKALTKGDKVITAGGIYGTIADIDETSVLIKVDGDVKIRVDKSCINKDTTASK